MTEYTRRIIEEIKSIPKGRVSCYRDIALRAGLPNGARQVVRTLHSLSEKHNLPWHRVLKVDGSIALKSGAGAELQAALLREEGVEVSAQGRVELEKFKVYAETQLDPRLPG